MKHVWQRWRSPDGKTAWGGDGGRARNGKGVLAEPSDVLGPELDVQSSGQLAATGRMVFFSHPGVRGRAAC